MKRILVAATIEVPDAYYAAFIGQRVQIAVEDDIEPCGWKLIDFMAQEQPQPGRGPRVDRAPQSYEEFLQMRVDGSIDPIYDEFANEMPSREMWESAHRRSRA